MVTKKELRGENQRLIETNQTLEQRIEFLEAQHETDALVIEELRKKNEINLIFGERTVIANYLSSLMHYLEAGRHDKAKPLLDMLSRIIKEKRMRFYQFEDRHRKKIFSIDREIQTRDAKLKKVWLYINYEDKERASIPYRVYELIKKEKKLAQGAPNIPETFREDEYVVMNEIIGPDLFTLFKSMEEKPETPAKKMLIDALLKKQLADTAYIRTGKYEFDNSLIINSSHGDKLLEVFEEAKIFLRGEEKGKIMSLAELINARAVYPMRDGASWNFKLTQKLADYFLSDDFLIQNNPDFEEIKKLVNKHLYAYDFDKLVRMTFQSDDAIHTLEWPLPGLTSEARRINEEYFIRKLAEHGENTKDYWALRLLEGFYRHTRMWFFYRCNQENYPDPDDRFKQHHLEMAFSSLYMHSFGREPPKEDLTKEGLANVSLEKILQLVMHPDCRAKAVEYPVKDAK